MILFYHLQQNIDVKLHMVEMVKPFPLELREADAASRFVLDLKITDERAAAVIT